jgi:NADPH-dependent ferric siderophore reductase
VRPCRSVPRAVPVQRPRHAPSNSSGPYAAYLAGEARTIQMIRGHLVNDRGWNRHHILTKPFWTPGKRGMH